MGNVWKSARLDAGDDQVGALDLCAAVCADRGGAGGGGLAAAAGAGWIVLCMVSARSAAMAFNRLVDARLDAANPRTKMRALPAGKLSAGFVAGFVVLSAAVFVLGAAMLNRLTLELALPTLAVLLVYSYMKRVTRWSHLVLGLALGIAPSAAWIAVCGGLDWRITVLTAAVLLWLGASMCCTRARTLSLIARRAEERSAGLRADGGVLDRARDAPGDGGAAGVGGAAVWDGRAGVGGRCSGSGTIDL